MVSELKKTGPKIHAQATNLGEQLPKWLDVQMAALEVSMMEGVCGRGGGGMKSGSTGSGASSNEQNKRDKFLLAQ